MPLQSTSGAASYDGFGGGVAVEPVYVEQIFSTYLYTGTNTNPNTITNGIDLSTKGGMVWCKARSAVNSNTIWDSVRGVKNFLITNATNANTNLTSTFPDYGLQSFNTNGFTLGKNYEGENDTGDSIASWTFREQAKFFDVVTGTCDGSGNITVNHSLGSVPGFVTIKRTDGVSGWLTYHTSLGNNQYLQLSGTNAASTLTGIWNATSTTFTANAGFAAGAQVVLYLWASNAGGFGLTGTDNVISCGSFTGTGSDVAVALGYEPQWLLVKKSSGDENWGLYDNMRGMFVNYDDQVLFPNTAGAEVQVSRIAPTATGFSVFSGYAGSGATYIYIAIRRGPMKVPTDGTKVYNAIRRSGTGAVADVTGVGFAPDKTIVSGNVTAGGGYQTIWVDRLRGSSQYIRSALTNAEVTDAVVTSLNMDGVTLVGAGASLVNASGSTYINWYFRRAPGFFDEVCYTGVGAADVKSHNLGVVPELMIVKNRSNAFDWYVFATAANKTLILNTTSADQGPTSGLLQSYTSTTFKWVDTSLVVNGGTMTYVAYLFATCAGVSKVGSYTGNGSTQAIACGFTGGARFVLIKRTDSTGDWYVYDTARGMTTLTDPYLLLNSTAAESATLGSVTTTTGGFTVNAAVLAAINTSGGSYIFLAIA